MTESPNNGKNAEPAASVLAVRLLRQVREVAAELRPHLSQTPVTLDSLLDKDLGFDSLGRVELLVRIERAFGIALPENAFANTETPRDLLRAVLGAAKGLEEAGGGGGIPIQADIGYETLQGTGGAGGLTASWTPSQIPRSNPKWKGAYTPGQLELTAWEFLKRFSSHYPGGNYGEMQPAEDDEDADPEEFLRWPISGQYEINCLACHHADPRQDQSGAALQAARQNYRWAATVASGLATVKGNASELDEFYDPETEYKIRTTYDKSRFDANNKVFLDIVRKPPSSRCYFCHSTQDTAAPGKKEWVHKIGRASGRERV